MKTFWIAALSLCSLCAFAQSDIPELDKSPLDIAYYPINYPMLKVQDKVNGSPYARIIYSRPLKQGRKIFGDLVEYGEIWRLGANEATELELFRDAVIGDKKVKKGRYTLYCIPETDKWTIIINSDNYVWGAFKYNKELDVARIETEPMVNDHPVEPFSIAFIEDGEKINLIIAWDTARVEILVTFK